MKNRKTIAIAILISASFVINKNGIAQQVTRPSGIIQVKKVDESNPIAFNGSSRPLFDEVSEKRDFKKRSIRKSNILNSSQQENINVSNEKKPCPAPLLVGTNFEGNRQTPFYLPPVGYYASECNIAISNAGKIVSISNGWMSYYNENGTLLFSDSLYHFGNSLIDCHVLYDPKKDRFVFIAGYGVTNFVNTFQGYGIAIAFSKTNDPMDGWNYYFIPDTKFSDNSVGDYPLLAISDDEAFITYSYYNAGEVLKHSLIIQLDKNAGYSGSSSINSQVYNVPFTGNIKGTVIPAQGGATTYGPNMYFMMGNETGNTSNKYLVYQVTNTIVSGLAVLNTYGQVQSNITHAAMHVSYQPGGLELLSIANQDHDFVQNAFYENGILQFCQNTNVNGKAGIFLGRISGIPNNLSCTAKTISDPNLYLSFPSIAYSGNSSTDNSAIVGIEHTGANTYPGLSAVYVNSNFDVSSLVTVKAGTDTINALWGDYSGICRRYNHPGECWFEGQYGSTTFPNINWIAKLKSQECSSEQQSNFANVKVNVPDDHSLSVFPNPTSGHTLISFTHAESQKVSINIFDMSGRLVKTLANTDMQAGTHQLAWDAKDEEGNNISAGIYVMRILIKDYAETKKIILER
ncbi:MAG: T9SS type A sorting domain-containing protein [Ferruginibacter sp.]